MGSVRIVMLCAALLPVAGCGIGRPQALGEPGGAVLDVDRSLGGAPWIGETDFPPSADQIAYGNTLADDRKANVPAEQRGPRTMVSGPITASPADAAFIRSVQKSLAERGYYAGPVNGLMDATLGDAIGRFQADQRLPVTGLVDPRTATALGVTPPPSAPPPAPHAG
jgi:hypothetical protein